MFWIWAVRLQRGIQFQRNFYSTAKFFQENAAIAAKHMRYLSEDDKRKFLNSFDTVFCDCDGVIWHTLSDIIPGSPEAIDYLKSIGKQVKFVTNNSITSIEQQMEKFQRFNMHVEQSDIVHPAASVCDYLKSINFHGLIFALTATPFKQQLRSAGFQLVDEKPNANIVSLKDWHEAIYNAEPVKAIIVDVDFNLTAAKMMRAHIHLRNDPECLLIAGAADPLIPFGPGDIIGPGPFMQVLERSADRTAVVLGKPGRALSELLTRKFPLSEPRRALFIGDSLATDVRFGRMCGFQTLLVLSGHTKAEGGGAAWDENEQPDYIVDSLRELQHLLN